MVEDVEKRMEASDTCTSLGNSGLERIVSSSRSSGTTFARLFL